MSCYGHKGVWGKVANSPGAKLESFLTLRLGYSYSSVRRGAPGLFHSQTCRERNPERRGQAIRNTDSAIKNSPFLIGKCCFHSIATQLSDCASGLKKFERRSLGTAEYLEGRANTNGWTSRLFQHFEGGNPSAEYPSKKGFGGGGALLCSSSSG